MASTIGDERMRAALGRLTDNEKQCLRRRLLHQTAKEMAIDLGISPHAVEKRLKMARAKLGVSSSLEAARLLERAEGYGPPVPQPADLGPADQGGEGEISPDRQRPRPLRVLTGASLMIAAILLSALFVQHAPSPPAAGEPIHISQIKTRQVGMDEAAAFLRTGFRSKDGDGSGFLNDDEVATMEPRDSQRDPTIAPAPPPGAKDPAASRKWMAKMDTDRDGRVSQEEYVSYMMPWILWQGVPADWPAPND